MVGWRINTNRDKEERALGHALNLCASDCSSGGLIVKTERGRGKEMGFHVNPIRLGGVQKNHGDNGECP